MALSRWFLRLVVTYALLSGAAFAQSMDDALQAYSAQDYTSAFKQFEILAKNGDADAQYYLGKSYDEGLGVSKGEGIALYWFFKAAEQGQEQASSRLSSVPYERDRAEREVVQRDQGDAALLEWLQRKAEDNNYWAMSELAWSVYDSGQLGQRDFKKAIVLYTAAAERGEGFPQTFSMWRLGDLNRRGLGTPQDFVVAYMWYNLAASLQSDPNSLASSEREALAKEMTPSQLDEGQRLSRKWIGQFSN